MPDVPLAPAGAADLASRCIAALLARGVPRETARPFVLRTLAARWAAALGVRGPVAPAALELTAPERELLHAACACDWSRAPPELLGALFERSLHADERHRAGAHFTAPADIMRIVGPTLVAPWTALIEQADGEPALRRLHDRMRRYTVLDPACGAGNFLAVAYRELKRLEATLLARLRHAPRAHVSPAQFHGIDTDPLAVEIARLALAIGHRAALDEWRLDQAPLAGLADTFAVTDAIVAGDGSIPPWPPVDVIIGNPPFLDARKLTVEHGRDYVRRLRAAYPAVPGRADYCVYWFRRAHDALPEFSERDPVSGRAGLVGTNTIRQNYSRQGGLDHIVAGAGTIVDAVASQVWSGAAAVHVSIVNWVKGPHAGPRALHEQIGDRRDSAWRSEAVAHITSALTARPDVAGAAAIASVTRRKRCFEGQQPGHTGFRIDLPARRALARLDPRLDAVVFAYINGDALLAGTYARAPEFVIDFGERTLAEAGEHPHVLALLERTVLPTWRANADRAGEHRRRLDLWWRLKRRRPELLAAVGALPRYIACVRHTKRPIFEFLARDLRPDSALTVFAFADDYSFGVLQSSVHGQWFAARCSSLGRTARYTSETVFDSFPWPQRAAVADIDRVVASARALRAARARALAERPGGLRARYRDLERGSDENPLRDAHAELDAAVLRAYEFTASDDILARLLELNGRIAGDPDAVAPGVPPHHPRPTDLVSADCVAPLTA